jgi:ABC-type phosphate/phosphonate transport system substrate-binding protein
MSIRALIIPAMSPPGRLVRLGIGLMAMLLLAAPALQVAAQDASRTNAVTEVRFAFSKSMFNAVNENDAKAAVKVYAQSLGAPNGIFVNNAEILDGTKAIAQALENQQADLFALTAEEFFTLEHLGLEGPLLMAKVNGSFFEDYLLLSREDGPVRQVADLKGRSLIVASDPRASLAALWLEVLCREHGLGPAHLALGKLTSAAKTTQVVLPVFFGQADACIVTRNGWEIMCELNPQLKKQLRVIAVSPSVVPTLTCFRHGFNEAFKQQILTALDLSATRPSYEQLMTLFKCDGLGHAPLAALDGTRELMSTYHQLCAGTNDPTAFALKPDPSPGETERKGM